MREFTKDFVKELQDIIKSKFELLENFPTPKENLMKLKTFYWVYVKDYYIDLDL
jgi:hypothetical protein